MSARALPATAENLFRYLFEQASLGIAVEDLEGKILLANHALCSMLGYQDDELVGLNCSQFANPEDSQDDWALFGQLRAGIIDHYSLEKRYLKKDGAPLWGRLNVSLLKQGNGESPLVFAFVENITKHKLDEAALHQKEKELAETQHQAGIGSWSWDARSDRVLWSKEISLRVGHDPSLPAPQLKDQASFFTAESWNRLQRTVQEALQTGKPYELDLEIASPTSKARWATARGEPLHDRDGQIIGLHGTVQDITEHKLAEQELARLNDRFRLALEASKSVAWEWDPKSGQLSWFGDLQDMFGISSDLFVGRIDDFYRYVHPEDRPMVAKAVSDARQNQRHYAAEFRIVRGDGVVRWVAARGSFYYEANGDPVRMTGMAVDITDRRRAEEALSENEQRFRLAVQAGRMYAFDWDVATDVIERSKECADILHSKDAEHDTGRSFCAKLHPDDVASYTATEARLIPENPSYQISIRILASDGSITWLEETGRAFFDSHGKMVRVIGMVADITQRKLEEVRLRESEARERTRVKELEAILDAVPVPVLIAHDAECRHITGNRAASEQLREARGQNLSQSAPPGERPAFRQIKNGVEISADSLPMQQAAATGSPMYQRELTLLYEDGTTREEIANAVPLLDESGKPCGAVGASIDVTELKRTERALRDSEDKLRLLLDSTAEAIYGLDLRNRCTFCNPAGLRALGYETVDEVLGKNMHELIHHTRADGTPFPAEECRIHGVTRTGEGIHAQDEVLWRANGTSFPAEYWSYPQHRGEEVVGAVVMFIDITQRKLAEAAVANVSRKLIEAQEQERTRIGRELHDDIGQRLALLAVELQRLQKDPLIFPRHRTRLEGLHKRASEIAADTQSLSHELHSARLQYLGIAAAMRGFCREFGEQQKVKIDFKINDLPGPLSAEISLSLFRVLQESLHNSAKHSGVGRFEVRLWGTPNDIRLTVKDSGKGFDREAASTSQGIGLISMEERLKLVNGTLSIDSQPGRGTTIEARVPVISGIESMGVA
jgi:PAS domain S-box-containing protein